MTETKLTRSPQEYKLFCSLLGGFWAVDTRYVDVKEVSEAGPNQIVQCTKNPAEVIRYFPKQIDEYEGCIAGWISESV